MSQYRLRLVDCQVPLAVERGCEQAVPRSRTSRTTDDSLTELLERSINLRAQGKCWCYLTERRRTGKRHTQRACRCRCHVIAREVKERERKAARERVRNGGRTV